MASILASRARRSVVRRLGEVADFFRRSRSGVPPSPDAVAIVASSGEAPDLFAISAYEMRLSGLAQDVAALVCASDDVLALAHGLAGLVDHGRPV